MSAEQPSRRRRRAHRAAGPPVERSAPEPVTGSSVAAGDAASTASAASAGSASSTPDGPGPHRHGGRRRAGRPAEPGHQHGRDSDRGWRDLVGNSPSQLGVSGALRARDVARPGPAELAAAERDLMIVHRQWQPPADDPAAGGP